MALRAAFLFAFLQHVDGHGKTIPLCGNPGDSGGIHNEHVLLQRGRQVVRQSDRALGPDMVNDESGFEGGDKIGEIADSSCASADVRRRRRAEAMCSCRRRDSGKRYDGGWLCQNDKMVQELPRYTDPVWSEEFDDERLNESKWTLTHSGSGNGNNEEQFYTTRSDNLQVQDGVLRIVGKREGFEGKTYTSGKITTKNKGDWGPGTRIEVRAKLPLGVGTWPAIWMMSTDSNYGNWPASGEIDIMEAIGKSHGKVFGTIHTDAYNHMKGTQKGKSFYTDFSEWHTYALDWSEDTLTWYTDGNVYNTFAPDNVHDSAKWPFNRRFYLLLNLALGGNLGGSINFNDDQVMEIDYVRVFCLDGSTRCKTEKITCCDKCPGQKYCSPKSGNCYGEKKSDYYDTCVVTDDTEPVVERKDCCKNCGGEAFCSPGSGKCYNFKSKDYYETCEVTPGDSSGDGECCRSCGGAHPFCSTVSGECYDSKRKDYYQSCTTTTTTPCVGSQCKTSGDGECCSSCGGAHPFCSTVSGECYDSKRKDYYQSCTTTTTTPCVGSQCKTIKIMSYNTEYKNYDSMMHGYAAKIRGVAPAIVGVQECQNRDGLAGLSGYTANKDTGSQNYMLFDPSKVTFVSGGKLRIPRDDFAERFITWGQFRLGDAVIWFFNTHLPHNHNEAASSRTHAKIAKMFLEKRKELGADNAPTVVVGDMNSHASNFNKVNGGGFESNLQANGFTWAYTARGNPGHGSIDHILYSTSHWTHSDCKDSGTGGSDHTSITCDLTLRVVEDVALAQVAKYA